MAEIKEQVGISEKVHIVLTGPDGKVKDERKPKKSVKKTEVRNVTSKESRIQK